jgi:electron transfer flavoprotein alpha subunit
MSVLAVAEQRDGVFRKVTYEALSEGKRLADSLGSDLVALVLPGCAGAGFKH